LKGVKYVDCPFKTHCVNRPERISPEIFNHFENSRPFAFPGLGPWVLAPKLGYTERGSDPIFTGSGNSSKSAFAEPTQKSGFSPGILLSRAM
jgi:hypothetical protein